MYFSSLTRADQSEDGALGVNGGQRILAARDFVRAVKDRATAGTCRVRSLVDVADSDVKGPRSLGHLRHPRHDGANHGLALVEEAVRAEVAHIHFALLPPAEVPSVEGYRAILVACLQLVPADVLRTIDGENVALRIRSTGGRGRFHQVEGRAVGIGHHGNAPDAANVVARHQRPPTVLLDPGDRASTTGTPR